jgi:hypothetical protein
VKNAKRVGTSDADPLLNGTVADLPSDSTPAIATQAIAGKPRRASETYTVEFGGLNCTATVSRCADGRLGEIFIEMIKAGSAADMAARDSAIVCSLALLCRDARGEAIGPLGAALDRLCAMEADW